MMSIHGVGALAALTFKAGVDVPQRFAKSKSVGAHFGLTPRRFSSGEIDYTGRISKCGDAMDRSALYEAANALLTRCTRWSALKAWAVRVAKRAGAKRARVAVARKLAVIMHRLWLDGTTFACGEHAKAAA